MIKKVINYENFDGDNVSEEAFFNLTKTELIDLAIDLPDGVSKSVTNKDPKDISSEEAVSKIMKQLGDKGLLTFIKELVLRSYGVKSIDGSRFDKIDENGKPLRWKFEGSLAFEAIMDEFRDDDLAAAEFVNGVIPKSLADKMPNVKNLVDGKSTTSVSK